MTEHSVSNCPALINPSSHSPFKIYIACLTSHLEGKQHGVWVDAHQSVEALEQAAQAMLTSSPAGTEAINWTILETEGFDPLAIDEFTPLKTIANAATFLTAYDELGAALIERFSTTLDPSALEKAQCLIAQNYHGVYSSKLDFVEHFFPITPPLSLRIEPSILHKLITEHLFIVYFFTLKIDDQWHVFNYPECTSMKPITLN